jgi:hypothetical protein
MRPASVGSYALELDDRTGPREMVLFSFTGQGDGDLREVCHLPWSQDADRDVAVLSGHVPAGTAAQLIFQMAAKAEATRLRATG